MSGIGDKIQRVCSTPEVIAIVEPRTPIDNVIGVIVGDGVECYYCGKEIERKAYAYIGTFETVFVCEDCFALDLESEYR